ncbi:MAG: T9SS type A sorting domain-containing protein [Bacteroidia bacterium]
MKQFLFSLLIISGLTGFAQTCTPDPLATAPGINPTAIDTVEVLVNQPMSQVYTVNVPQDTTVTLPPVPPFFPGGTFTVQIIKQTIVSVDGLPLGTSHACNSAGCSWVGGSQGCFKVSGTPTVLGTYNVTVNISTQASDPAPGIPFPSTPVPYPIAIKVVDVLANEGPLDVNAFRLAPAQPNPSSFATTFAFSTPTATQLTAQVTDITGRVIKTEKLQANSGLNEYRLNTTGFASGMYIFSLNNGKASLQQKFVVE